MQVTPQQLGYEIYNSCKAKSEKLLVNYEQEKEDMNDQEVIIAFMWTIFDLLNMNPKYEKTTHYIFSAYVNDYKLSKAAANAEMHRLEKKFHEYRNLFRKNGKTDRNYLPVATKMTEYVAGDMTNVIFASILTIALQEFVIMWIKLLKDTSIEDA